MHIWKAKRLCECMHLHGFTNWVPYCTYKMSKTAKRQHNKLLPGCDLLTWNECVLRTVVYEGNVFLNPGQALESGWLDFRLVSLLRSKQGFLCIVQPHNNFLVSFGISSPQYCYLVNLCFPFEISASAIDFKKFERICIKINKSER